MIGGRKVPKPKVGCDFKEGKKGRPIFFCMSAVAEMPVQLENAQACSHVCTFALGLASRKYASTNKTPISCAFAVCFGGGMHNPQAI